MSGDELFDTVSQWRVEAVRTLGLIGERRIAGAVTGAAYPDALEPIVDAVATVLSGVVCDVGAGLGGATQWLGLRAGVPVVAIEPERVSAAGAVELFPDLPIVVGTATALPLADARCGAVALLGVVSLVSDLDEVLDEAARVLRPGGVLALSDLCWAEPTGRSMQGSPNVFRHVDLIAREVERRGLDIIVGRSDPADRSTRWDEVGTEVDELIERRHGGDDAFITWRHDRLRLRNAITSGDLVIGTVIARA